MAIDDTTTKKAVLSLLRRGLVTQSEAARLAGRSRQIVAHWAKDLPDSRAEYLAKAWESAIKRASR
jgi:predicted transcriptional regulator